MRSVGRPRARAAADRRASSRAHGAPSGRGSRSASRRTTCRSSIRDDPACPVRRQCVPDAREADDVPGDLVDPLGEAAHEVAPHLVQRYPDRVLLLATDRCAVYCRFCTRSRMVGGGDGAVLARRARPRVRLAPRPPARCATSSSAAGDPLAMATDAARAARRRGARRPQRRDHPPRHARSRHPADAHHARSSFGALRPHHPLWVMTHFNHPRELTREAIAACERLADAGFPVMNQTVLLAGHQRRRGDARDALPRPRARSRAPVLPPPGRPGPRHGASADTARARRRVDGAPSGTPLGHRAAEAHLRYAGRPRQGPALADSVVAEPRRA